MREPRGGVLQNMGFMDGQKGCEREVAVLQETKGLQVSTAGLTKSEGAVSLMIGLTMRSLFLVLAVLVLLSYVPPVRSGPNAFVRGFFSTCWRMKGVCRRSCLKKEVFYILCDNVNLCCVKKKYLPEMQ
ncbi:beta-defensin 135 [Desmodus rotundus]|uniref:beta-defensin 135 n=1 Tax=Desmodus rotundus TaxID=9430 RepID=UPI000D180A89|nr:beta-defensin 135 [Desmodus rotundus]